MSLLEILMWYGLFFAGILVLCIIGFFIVAIDFIYKVNVGYFDQDEYHEREF